MLIWCARWEKSHPDGRDTDRLVFAICTEVWCQHWSWSQSSFPVVPFGISHVELEFNSFSCNYLPGLVFLPLPILCLFFIPSALTIWPELIPTDDEPSDFGRNSKWPWAQKHFEAEIVLHTFFPSLCPSVLLLVKKKIKAKKKKSSSTDIIW